MKQKETAVGLVTIGRNMLLRDLLQAVWRLRQIDKNQKIAFCLSEEVETIICQTFDKKPGEIKLDDILAIRHIQSSQAARTR